MWLDAFYLPWNKKYNTQQFDGERKNKIQILFDSLLWTLKYKEVCTYYFAYGLDLKGHNPNDYVGYSEFRMMRNILNIRERENLQTLYTFNYLALTRDKFIFYKYCDSVGVPHPRTIGLIREGKVCWFKEGMHYEDLETILGANIEAFCKETTGESGKGAFVLVVKNNDIYINGELSTLSNLKRKIGKASYILQEKLVNHHRIDKIYPKSLNTLKLITFMQENGEVEYYGAELRFGSGGKNVDNASQGGFFVGVTDDGKLMNVGYYEPGVKQKLVVNGVHPDTGVQFASMDVPYWHEIVKAAKELHRYFYGIPSIGWDIAITNNGYSFTETGEDWEIPLNQCAFGGQREKFYRTHGRALNVKIRKY